MDRISKVIAVTKLKSAVDDIAPVVGAFGTWHTSYALHACGAPRKQRCAHARLLQPRVSRSSERR